MGITTRGGREVQTLRNNGDGTLGLRLHSKVIGEERWLTLREPSAREYAEIRVLIRDVDDQVRDAVPIPAEPVITDDMTPEQTGQAVVTFNEQVEAFQRDRKDMLFDPEKGPYALVICEVAKRLGGTPDLTFDDLLPEAFMVPTCSALLEVWEGPLGGPAVPDANPVDRKSVV